MTRVLVTCSQGNVGREAVRACRQAGLDVREAVHSSTLKSPAPSDQAVHDSQVLLDFTEPTSWAAALADVDGVLLIRPPQLAAMKTTLNPFIDAAFAAGVKHLVFVSVDGAQRRRWVPHRQVEDHLRMTQAGWTVLRPGFFAQNLGDAYLADVRDDSRLYVPAAMGRVAFLDVADIGDVAACIFGSRERFRGQAIRLAGPQALTFAQLAQRLSALLHRPVAYQPASVVGYLWHLWHRRHLSFMQAVVLTVLHVGLRSGDAERTDDQQLALLGRPATPIANYLERSKALWL